MRAAQWFRLGLAAAVLAGWTTLATAQEASTAPAGDQLPAGYPRLDPHDPQGQKKLDEAVKAWFEPPPADQPQPKLVCDEPNAPARTTWKGRDFTSSWEIRNDGAATLRVSVLTTCKAAVRGPWVREIAPGERSTIEVKIGWGRVGQSSDCGQLRTNDRATPKLALCAEANVLCALRGDQPYGWWRVDFGELPRDAGPQTKSIVFERGDGGPVDVKLLGIERAKDPPSDNVEAVVRMLEPGEKYAVDITVRPPWTGWTSGRVRIATGVPEQPEDEISFVARVPPRLAFTCEPATLPRVRTETATMKLWPKWSADQPPGHIVGVDCDVPGMSGGVEEEAGKVFVLVVVSPNCAAPTPALSHAVTVRTDDPAAAEVKAWIRFER